jgi:hypothetical protein
MGRQEHAVFPGIDHVLDLHFELVPRTLPVLEVVPDRADPVRRPLLGRNDQDVWVKERLRLGS